MLDAILATLACRLAERMLARDRGKPITERQRIAAAAALAACPPSR